MEARAMRPRRNGLSSNDDMWSRRFGRTFSRAGAYREAEAAVDEKKTDELGHVENLYMPEACERSADPRENCPDRDQRVTDDAVPLSGLARELNRGFDRPTDQEDDGVQVDER